MASGTSEWKSPSKATSPKRIRVQQLRQKFEPSQCTYGPSSHSSAPGSSHKHEHGFAQSGGSGSGSSRGSGHGSSRGSGHGSSRGSGHGSSRGSGHGSSRGSGHGSSRGSGRGHGHSRGSGSRGGSKRTQGSSQSYSDSLGKSENSGQSYSDSLEESMPSFSNVLESTRMDGGGRQQQFDQEPTGMDPSKFQSPDNKPPTPRQDVKKKTDENYEDWYQENIEKVSAYDMLVLEIVYILSDHVPGIHVDEEYPAEAVVAILKEFVNDITSKFRKFDLDLHQVQEMDMAGEIHDHKRKVLEVISELEMRLEGAKEEASQLRSHVDHLDSQLTAAYQIIEKSQGDKGKAKSEGLDSDFMDQLKASVSFSLSENYEEEIMHLRQENKQLSKKLADCEREKVEREEQCMRDLSQASQKSDLNSKLKEGLMSMLEKSGDKKPNEEDARKVFNKWYQHLKSVVRDNEGIIEQLTEKCESTGTQKDELTSKCRENEEAIEKLEAQIKKNKNTTERHQEQKQCIQREIDELNEEVKQLQERKDYLQSYFQGKEHFQSTPARESTGETHTSESSGGTHGTETSSGTHGAAASGRTHSTGSSGGTHSTGTSGATHRTGTSGGTHSTERSGETHSTGRSGGTHSTGRSGGTHSPGSYGGTQNSERSDEQLGSGSGKSQSSNRGEMDSPETQSPMRRFTRREVQSASADDRNRSPVQKPYFPSQGPDYGSYFSFRVPNYEQSGYSETPPINYMSDEEYYQHDPDAVIQPHMFMDSLPVTPPYVREESMDDSVFLPGVDPTSFKKTRELIKYRKQLKYRHIFPSFGPDEDYFVDIWRFRNIPTDSFFLSSYINRSVESPPRNQDTFTKPDSRFVQSASADDRDNSYGSPAHRPYYASQGFSYGSDPNFEFSRGSFGFSPSEENGEMQNSSGSGGTEKKDSPDSGGTNKCDHDQMLIKKITIDSPGKDPLEFEIEVKPESISGSTSGEHVVCNVAVNVHDVLRRAIQVQEKVQRRKRKQPKKFVKGTPPTTPTKERDPKMGTPKSIFKQRHYGIRNLFDSKKDPYEYKAPQNKTIEWEQKTPEFETTFHYSPQTAWKNFSNTPINAPEEEEQETESRWGALRDPETSSHWNNESGGKSPPKELSQTYPGTQQYKDDPPTPNTA